MTERVAAVDVDGSGRSQSLLALEERWQQQRVRQPVVVAAVAVTVEAVAAGSVAVESAVAGAVVGARAEAGADVAASQGRLERMAARMVIEAPASSARRHSDSGSSTPAIHAAEPRPVEGMHAKGAVASSVPSELARMSAVVAAATVQASRLVGEQVVATRAY